jgi:hypothetical protein
LCINCDSMVQMPPLSCYIIKEIKVREVRNLT